MRNIFEKERAIKLRSDGHSYHEIGQILDISRQSARNLCVYKYKKQTMKRGPKFKINQKAKLSIKRSISKMFNNNEKVNSSKILADTCLQVSRLTVQRYLKRIGLKYKKIKKIIFLSRHHKEERVKIVTEWLCNKHNWNQTAFSDEKRFTLDGPDDWTSYVPKSSNIYRQIRQCKGGGFMIWLMALPNGLLSYRIVEGTFNSNTYLSLLKETVVPMLKLNYGDNCYFQDDNCSVHRAKIVKEFIKSCKLKTINWPSKSPDINIVEDIWKILSDSVYDGRQFQNKTELKERIKICIQDLNANKRYKIQNLYSKIVSRLCKLLSGKGNLSNKLV